MLLIEADLGTAFADLERVADRAGEALHWAVWQGAEILRIEAELQAPRSSAAHYFYSKGRKNSDGSAYRYRFEPGSLKKSVYVWTDKQYSEEGVRWGYTVSYRKSSSQLGYVPYAHMVHDGVVRAASTVPANPFIQRAYDLRHKQAEARIIDVIEKAVYGKADNRGGEVGAA